MTKRSVAVVGCLLWSLALPVQAADAPPLLVRVLDGEGRPVAGAKVRAMPEQTDPQKPELEIREETSAEGTARISGLPADRLSRVLVEREGYAPELRSLAADANRELRIALRPGGLLVGQVVDEKGRPVPGAEVELAGAPFGSLAWEIPRLVKHQARHHTRTGPAGRFRFRDLPGGPFELTIRHAEHATLIADRPVEGRTTGRLGTFVLRTGTTLRGTVTDAAGQPVAGARIWALLKSELEPAESFPAPSTATAGDGTFSIPHRGQDVDLWVCADGFLEQNAPVHFPEEPMEVRLLPAGSVRGRVLGPDGSPMAGATVEASRSDGVMECGGLRMVTPCPDGELATTDAEGWFHLARLWPAWYTVSASAPGLMAATSSPTRAAGGEPAEVELRFQKGATVSGRVVAPDGRPVPGTTVWISSETSSAEVKAAADGSFRIAGVAAGKNDLAAQADGYDYTERELEVTGGEVRADLVLEPDPALEYVEVRGRVLGPDGAPVEGARVFSSDQGVHSAWDGSFTLRVCVCGSTGWRWVQAEKQGFVRGHARFFIEGRPVDGVEVRLETGARVTGRVDGLTADEMRRVTIQLMDEDMKPPVLADAEGRFEIGPVSAGTWTVTAALEGRTKSAEVTAEPGAAEAFVELTFTPVRPVSGRVSGVDGEPLAGIEVLFRGGGSLSTNVWTRADGSFTASVPEGDFAVSVRQGAREHTQPLGAETGPVTGLEIGLPRGATLRGRILGLPHWELTSVRLEGPSPHWGEVDLDGGWSVEGLSPGSWTLIATRELTSQEIRQTIEVPEGFAAPDIEIDLDFTAVPMPAEEEP